MKNTVKNLNIDEFFKSNTNDLFELGMRYYFGDDEIFQDYEKSFDFIQKVYETDLKYELNEKYKIYNVLYSLGKIFRDGIKAKKDYYKALYCFKNASEQGHSKAQYNLALMYYHGYVVEQNYNKAFYWFEKSCEKGNSESKCNIGVMYYYGQGVEKDYYKAIDYLEKSASKNNVDAQYNLGFIYYNLNNIEKSLYWLSKAVRNGSGQAKQLLKKVKKKNTIKNVIRKVPNLAFKPVKFNKKIESI